MYVAAPAAEAARAGAGYFVFARVTVCVPLWAAIAAARAPSSALRCRLASLLVIASRSPCIGRGRNSRRLGRLASKLGLWPEESVTPSIMFLLSADKKFGLSCLGLLFKM